MYGERDESSIMDTFWGWMPLAGVRARTRAMTRNRDRERWSYVKRFLCKYCKRYEPDSSDSPSAPCKCGRRQSDHIKTLEWDELPFYYGVSNDEPDESSWNINDYIIEQETNAYGIVLLKSPVVAGSNRPAEYVKMSYNSPMRSGDVNVLGLLTNVWSLMKPFPPKLVISVMGGRKNFHSNNIKTTFTNNLVNAVKSTRAWVLTDGLNRGVTRMVGQAISEVQSVVKVKEEIVSEIKCVGVTPYGLVKDNKKLIKDGPGDYKATSYDVTDTVQDGRVSLNGDHTHFLLVDHLYGDERANAEYFLTELERSIQTTEGGGLGIPVVLVVVDGGPPVLRRCAMALERGVPLVVVKNTGRTADVLATLNIEDREFTDLINEYFSDNGRDEVEECVQSLRRCSEHKNNITVYDTEVEPDLQLTILNALITCIGSEVGLLKLALHMDRADIAEKHIFSRCKTWSVTDLDDITTEALLNQRTSFVDLLLRKGVQIENYLTPEMLGTLYLQEPEKPIQEIIEKNEGKCWPVPAMPNTTTYKTDDSYYYLDIVHRIQYDLIGNHSYEYYSWEERQFKVRKNNLECREKRATVHRISPIEQYKQSSVLYAELLVWAIPQDPYNELLIWAVITRREELAENMWWHCKSPLSSALAATGMAVSLSNALNVADTRERAQYAELKKRFEHHAVELIDESYKQDQTNATSLSLMRNEAWGGITSMELALLATDKVFISTKCAQDIVDNYWQDMRWKFGLWLGYRAVLLILHVIMILFNLHAKVCLFEVMLAILVLFDALQKAIELVTERSSELWKSLWNYYDVITFTIFIIAFILRFIPGAFLTSKVLYAGCGALFTCRLFRIYYLWARLGPLILVFVRMTYRLLEFLAFFGIFILAYGFVSTALIRHPCSNRNAFTSNSSTVMAFFEDLILPPYWTVYGELQLDSFDDTWRKCYLSNESYVFWPSCTPCNEGTPNCQCQNSEDYIIWVKLSLGFYLIIGNVLLLNLLIAIFTNEFESIQHSSIEYWNLEMYRLMRLYERKPFLPPPIAPFIHLIWMCESVCMKDEKETEEDWNQKDMMLMLFEKQKQKGLQDRRPDTPGTSNIVTLEMIDKLSDAVISKQGGVQMNNETVKVVNDMWERVISFSRRFDLLNNYLREAQDRVETTLGHIKGIMQEQQDIQQDMEKIKDKRNIRTPNRTPTKTPTSEKPWKN